MRGSDVHEVEMTPVTRSNVKTFLRSMDSLTPRRVGADVGAWLNASGGKAAVDFRIPYADFKHPSSLEINTEAEHPKDVFMTGKYQAVRFQSLGERTANVQRMREARGDWDVSEEELRDEYESEMTERKRAFESAVKSVLSSYSGISGRVDMGDAAFSKGHNRPHVRLYSIDCDGATFGQFVHDCVDKVESEVYNCYHIR